VGAWWTATAGPLLTAVGSIAVAWLGYLATRGKARREEIKEKSRRTGEVIAQRDELYAQRDTLYDYVYELRGVCHANGIDPPPWPKQAAPPWAVTAKGSGDDSPAE
jgi:hypothetical protein